MGDARRSPVRHPKLPGSKLPLPERSFPSRVSSTALQSLLDGYDVQLSSWLIDGFANGFPLGCHEVPPMGDAGGNLPSCNEAPHAVDEYLAAELAAGRIAGPFPPESPWITKISPIGLIPKKSPGTYRIIHHLSFPFGESVNDFISRECTTVTYGSIDQAVHAINEFSSPFLAKTDIASAFRLIPVRRSDCPLLGFRWRNELYVVMTLPMGCASSSQIFQSFSDALVWIAQNKFSACPIISVLDDFLFVAESESECRKSLSGFQELCRILNVPLRPDKTRATVSLALLPRR